MANNDFHERVKLIARINLDLKILRLIAGLITIASTMTAICGTMPLSAVFALVLLCILLRCAQMERKFIDQRTALSVGRFL